MAALEKEIRLLVIEDNPGDYFLIQEYLLEKIEEPHLKHVTTLAQTENALEDHLYDAILLDLALPDASGESLVQQVVAMSKDIPVIVLTGYENEAFGLKTLGMGIADYLLKDELTPFLLYKSISYSIERNRVNRSLKKSEKKYREIFNLSPQPMWVYDLETLAFLDVNQAATDHYGYSRQEFLEMTLEDIRPKEKIPDLIEAVELSRGRDQFFYEGVFQHLTKSGKLLDVKIKSNIIEYQGRKAEMVLAEDITDQLKAERELKLSEQKFKALVQEGADIISILDSKGRYKYSSPNHRQITGWTPGELSGTEAADYIHPEDLDALYEAFETLEHNQSKQLQPFRFRHKEEGWIWFECVVSDLTDDPAIGGYIINTNDITEQKYYRDLEKLERDVLEMNVRGEDTIRDIAREFILGIEQLHPRGICSIMQLKEGALCNFASPGLHDGFLEAINGVPIGPDIGTCGAAAFNKELVITENIFEDPNWKAFADIAKKYNLSSCWSQPVTNNQQEVVATFAVYYREPNTPNELELNTIKRATHILRMLFESFEKKKTERQLALSEQRFRSLVQDGSDLIAILDQEGTYKYVAPSSIPALGISPEEFTGTNALDYIHENDRERIAEIIENLPSRERAEIKPFRFRNAGGEWRWVETIITNMLENPAVEGFVANSRDVTERIERQQKLKESVHRYEIVAKATSDTIWDLDLEEDTIRYNRNIYSMFGYARQEVKKVGEWWRQNLHPEDREKVLNQIEKTLAANRNRFQLEYRFQCADGSYKDIYDRAFVVTDDKGEPVRIIGAMQDVTEQKEEKRWLKLFESAVATTSESVVIIEAEPTDLPGRKILYVNDAFSKMTGYSREEATGNTLHILNGPETSQAKRDKLREAMERWESCETEFINYTKEGEKFWIHVSMAPVKEKDGEYSHWVCVGRDVTNRRQRERELKVSLAEKETLLLEIHHRVKNNLAVVSGMMQLQAFGEEDERVRQKLIESVSRIQTMASIHELLYQSESFSRLSLDENIEQLVSTIIDTVQVAIDLDVSYKLDPVILNINQAIPCSLIVNEVVTNALQHAFNGRDIGQLWIDLDEKKDRIEVRIKDNGRGLPDNFGTISLDNSLGLKLIDTLATQLDGTYSYKTQEPGALFTLSFEKAEVKGVGNVHLK
ncbi:PAS domain S-box protein [Halalkalibaculum sp. DA384]|uniref:PAS domain S-box protein n=1 Tax=Halalkalibaculum sp. DA384 TaxID=3373606 RepID=UPI00375461C7